MTINLVRNPPGESVHQRSLTSMTKFSPHRMVRWSILNVPDKFCPNTVLSVASINNHEISNTSEKQSMTSACD